MTYHVVEFHADGGQMCVEGRRVFTDEAQADGFAERMRNEEGHSCGPESVRQYKSETSPGGEGDIYRHDMTVEKYKTLHEVRQHDVSPERSGVRRFFASVANYFDLFSRSRDR